MDKKKYGFTTRQIHGEGHPKPLNAHTRPIFQSSTFVFDTPEQGAALFAGQMEGHIYTRLHNPTTEALERTLASLEGCESAVVFASGMASIEGALLPFLKHGDHVICGDVAYGPVLHLIGDLFKNWGMESTFVNTANLDEVKSAIRPNTKWCFFETPANPTNRVTDIAAVAEICHSKGVRICVDNTFATPYNQRPREFGCDLIMHSATKYLNGHGDVIAGCIIGDKADMDIIRKFRTDTGACISPFDSFLFLRGLKTLSMRMETHNYNAMKLAEYLENHPDISKVYYPGLKNDPGHEIAKKQMSGFSSVISFEHKGGFEAGRELLRHFEVITLAVSLGTIDSLIQHPASMTHSHVPKEMMVKQGLTESLIRMSVGCENIEDLLADMEQALVRTKAAVGV